MLFRLPEKAFNTQREVKTAIILCHSICLRGIAMPTLVTNSVQKVTDLYDRLSNDEQNVIVSLMEIFLRKKNDQQPKKSKNIMSLAGSLKNKTNIKLSDDELNEAIRRSYYARDEQ